MESEGRITLNKYSVKEKATAYHEAGHTLVDHRFHHFIIEATIVRKDNVLGAEDAEGDDCSRQGCIERIIALYAGFAPESRYHKKASKLGSWSDDEKAEALLKSLQDVSESSLREKAKEMIDKDWAIIEAMAKKLLQYKTLPGDDIAVLIDAFDDGEDWEKCFNDYRALKNHARHQT